MTTDTENQYPFTSKPKPNPVYRVGAYEQGELKITIPCNDTWEAQAIGKALESQGYQVRLRAGATLPDTLADEGGE